MAGFRHCFPDLLCSGVFPSLPFGYRFSKSPTCLGSHASSGSVSPRAWFSFSAKADLPTLMCIFVSLHTCSTIPFAWWSSGRLSVGTASKPAASAACVFNATIDGRFPISLYQNPPIPKHLQKIGKIFHRIRCRSFVVNKGCRYCRCPATLDHKDGLHPFIFLLCPTT